MRIKSFDGTKISYRIRRKQNIFLIFIHGWVNNWTAWRKELLYFEKLGYSTLALDLRGHGESDKPEEKERYKLENFARDIDEIIRKEKIKDFVLIGHSMGGMIALEYFNLYHKIRNVSGLVLCDTTSRNVLLHKSVNKVAPFVRHVLDFLIFKNQINKEHFRHMKDIDLSKYANSTDVMIFYHGLHNTPTKSVFACLEEMMDFDLTRTLNKINVPVLILEGEDDKYLTKLCAKELARKIKGSKLKTIPRASHCINIESSQEVEKEIEKFLGKVPL